MKIYKVVVSFEVEADDQDEAINEACRLDRTIMVESIVEIPTPEVTE